MTGVDRYVLVAFGVVGAVWVVGIAVVVLADPVGVSVAGAFVLIFAPAIASRRVRTDVALLAAWLVAVLAIGAVIYAEESLPGEVMFLGGLLGTVLFCAWVRPSFVFLVLLDPSRTRFKV